MGLPLTDYQISLIKNRLKRKCLITAFEEGLLIMITIKTVYLTHDHDTTGLTKGIHPDIIKQNYKHLTNKGRKLKLVECPHCNTKGKGGNMTRYHFNNCKQK